MYKSQQESYIKSEMVHVATEFNKQKFKDIDSIKSHIQTCKYICNQYDVDDEDSRVSNDQTIGIQHQKVCCGYISEVRVPMCSNDHQLVYVVIQKEIGPKSKAEHLKWIKKISQ